MKKFLLILLALMLVLSGCANQDQQTATTAPTTEPTEPPGLYAEDSAIEKQTKGAVRVYELGENTYDTLSMAGEKLLLGATGEQTALCVLEGERGVTAAEVTLGVNIANAAFQTVPSGVVYYDQKENCAVYLDMQLQELRKVALPEDAEGVPVFSQTGTQIFYCAGQEIRALDVEQGFSRLVKSQTCKSQTLTGCFFDGKLLVCSIENEAGEFSTAYISAETGQTMRVDNDLQVLDTYEDQYFVARTDGGVPQRLFGAWNEERGQQLNALGGTAASALELGGIVCYSTDGETGLHLEFYALDSGKKTADISISGVSEPIAIQADKAGNCVWLLADAGQSRVLLRWDLQRAEAADEQVYTSPVFTAATPDEDGLSACEERADALADKHGVTILLWKNAAQHTGNYSVVAEYQTIAINQCLDQLESVLNEMPEDFLYKSVVSKVRIGIVRSITGKDDAVQYWENGNAYILIPATADVRNSLIKAAGYVVDSHVLGNSPMYDYWKDLNPEGFVYGDETTYSQEYLSGETQAFADRESMATVTEDRCRIFFEAMKPDNAEMFKSEAMQQKLLLLCKAIRDAWRWEKKSEVYPWEQYLTESIAYNR